MDVNDQTGSIGEETVEFIEKLLKHAAEKEGITKDTEISLTFVTNEEIKEINREYRGKDSPTDVISFAMEEQGEGEIEIIGEESMPTVLGDIIISIERAKEQAEEYGHSYKRELGFLTVHGFLHLLGYDHMNEEDEKEMFGRQDEILHSFGLRREDV
ncbi:rRNA maturation RNase YbeY [Chungangia koreensis]|uniref:Endoribonuclease YbeY n=1 Tax=Chungangia koreensis TaxID=752657 RepID=A0ABV8X7U7_9LACT